MIQSTRINSTDLKARSSFELTDGLNAITRPQILIGLVLLTLATTCLAQSEQRDDGARFTRFAGFTLDAASLSEVQARLGPAVTVKTGEAGEFSASVCYFTGAGVITFLSGELGGGTELLGITLSRRADRPPCSKWPSAAAIPRLRISDLRLGMSPQEFRKAVAKPARWEGQHASVTFDSTRPMTGSEQARRSKDEQDDPAHVYDVVIAIDADFSNGRLTELTVYKTETS